jgi:hypothetical protein
MLYLVKGVNILILLCCFSCFPSLKQSLPRGRNTGIVVDLNKSGEVQFLDSADIDNLIDSSVNYEFPLIIFSSILILAFSFTIFGFFKK